MIIRPASHGNISWLGEQMSYCPGARAKGIIAGANGGFIEAAVLYDHWTLNAVQVHVYAPVLKTLFSKPFLHAMFSYPFVQCNRGLLVAVTPADQKGSLAVSGWLGFKEKYRIRDGWKLGVDMVLRELRREDCRFILQDVKSA